MPTPSFSSIAKTTWTHVVIALLLLPSLVWVLQDRTIWPWDQAWYGEVSVDLWFWLVNSPKLWFRSMLSSLPTKPPGIVWLGQFFVPFRGLFGSVEAALLISVLLTQAAMLVILEKIGRRMAPHSRLVPLVLVVFASGTQLFVGLSHQFFVEPLQAVAVGWCFYIALRCADWTRARIVLHLASALILGALAKATTPLYCLMPCLYVGYQLARGHSHWNFAAEWRSWSSRALVIVFGPAGILGALWYLRNLDAVWQHVREASSSDIALDYGARDTVINKLAVWFRLLKTSFLSPYLFWGFLAAIVAGGGFVMYRKITGTSGNHHRLHPVAILSLIQICLLLLVFSLNVTVDPKYMLALLPCVMILLIQMCVSLPRIALLALIALGAAQWVAVNRVSFDASERLADQSNWLLPLQTDRSQYDELSRAVYLTSDVADRYNIVAIDYRRLNANSAEFFSAKERLETGRHSYYTSLKYAEKDVDKALRRIEEFQTRYLITLSEESQVEPDFVNVVTLPILQRMRRDSRFAPCHFPSAGGLLIFRFAPGIPAPGVEHALSCEAVQSGAAQP